MKFNDLFEFVVSINEVFDTKIPVEDWSTDKDARVGRLKVDDAEYIIKLNSHTYSLDSSEYNFINVVFQKVIDGKPSEDLTYDNRAGSKVIGAIVHAVKTEIQKFDTDAIVFIATDSVEKRMRIYNKLLSNLGLLTGEFSSYVENVKIPNGLMSIIFNRRISNAEKNTFIEHLKKQEK